jgi:ABC-type transport system involved in multi-copper enzyme maturation permease subunit
MYLLENPVLQRELLVNLRMRRAFVLLLGYNLLLAAMVFYAWPRTAQIDISNPEAAERLVNMFFLGQYLLASLMSPSFAAAAITGEKERATYEMLLASPMKPGAIVLGKLLASLAHLTLLIFSSLPIVMLCLPLGGTNLYELLAVYLALIMTTFTFGMISLACSSYFKRTAAALVVSYLLILPLALLGLLCWNLLESLGGSVRLFATLTLLPAFCVTACGALFLVTSLRLLHPPDVGSEGKDVIDEEREQQEAVGLVIRRDQFPDRLFAPAKRTDLLAEGANPVYDKEMRSEIFSQGTLMLRVVIQVSMLLAIPLMAFCLYIWPRHAPWYVGYVVLFNMLVGPVFSAGSVTSERERQTLELLLTTIITPGQILWGKLISGLRVSSVLTSFLVWPLLLAWIMPPTEFWRNSLTMLGYLGIILITCLTTATIALFCSVLFRKTSVSLMTSYLLIVLLFAGPLATSRFAQTFFPTSPAAHLAETAEFSSPIGAAFALPLDLDRPEVAPRPARWDVFFAFLATYGLLNVVLLSTMTWLFHTRWRVAY